MDAQVRRLLEQILDLSDDDRRALIEEVVVSRNAAPVELSPAWEGEVAGRIAALERGDVKGVPWSGVEATIARTLERS